MGPERSQNPIVELRSISKSFGGTKALQNVDLTMFAGTVHGLIGENGAGKSTLIKILSGAYRRDSGHVSVLGEEVDSVSPYGMLERGISVIYQEILLAPDLSIAENIFIEKLSQNSPFIDWKNLRARAEELLSFLGFGNLNPRALVQDLTVAEQQVVEICKALARESKVIVFDEPTAVLTSSETKTLLALIGNLREKGVSVLYVSHRLNELFEVCDDVTVLKDGELVGTYETSALTEQKLIRYMVGRDMEAMFPPQNRSAAEVILRVENLQALPQVKEASFEVKRGEVVGFAGLVGSGRTELMRALFGIDQADTGNVIFNGKKYDRRTPVRSIRRGMGFVPEDRKGQGLLLEQSIRANLSMVSQKANGLINLRREAAASISLLERFQARYSSIDAPVSSLSGGNQQKISLAKWLTVPLNLIIFDEPTRGVDIGAKFEIYKIIEALAEDGYAIIVVSSELPEVIGICDRVYVMREGNLVGHLAKNNVSEENIMEYAMGVNHE